MDALNTFFESGAFAGIFICIVIIICLREVCCWYWKINDNIKLQNQQINLLVEIIDYQKKEIELLEKALAKEKTPDTIDS